MKSAIPSEPDLNEGQARGGVWSGVATVMLVVAVAVGGWTLGEWLRAPDLPPGTLVVAVPPIAPHDEPAAAATEHLARVDGADTREDPVRSTVSLQPDGPHVQGGNSGLDIASGPKNDPHPERSSKPGPARVTTPADAASDEGQARSPVASSPEVTIDEPMSSGQMVSNSEQIGAETMSTAPQEPATAKKTAARATEPPDEHRQPASVAAPLAVVHRSNLRAGPDPSTEILTRLDPGDWVTLLEGSPRLGYYHVVHDGHVGWIWWRNVDVAESSPQIGDRRQDR